MAVHSYNVEIAIEYGIEEAILIHHFAYWIGEHVANGIDLHEGRFWSFDKTDALYAVLPEFKNKKKIEYFINKLVDKDILMKGNFNNVKFDRTLWYTFTDNGLRIIFENRILTYECMVKIIEEVSKVSDFDFSKFRNGNPKNENTITHNNQPYSNNSPITDSPTMNSSPINSPIITLEESRITSNTPKENDQPTIFKDDIPQEKVLDEKEIIQLIMSFWNTETKFTKIRSIEGTRRKMLIARLKEEGADNVMKAIQIANQSSFLTEKWKMNFDWFVKPSNFNKVVEGNYNNDNAYGNSTSRPTDSQLLGAAIRNSWGPDGNPFD